MRLQCLLAKTISSGHRSSLTPVHEEGKGRAEAIKSLMNNVGSLGRFIGQLWTGGLPHDDGNPMRGPAAPPCHSSIDHPPNPGVVAVAMMMTIVMMLLMTINHGRRMMFRLIIILIIMAMMAIIPISVIMIMVMMLIAIAHGLRR
jgi:hypothetical protein